MKMWQMALAGGLVLGFMALGFEYGFAQQQNPIVVNSVATDKRAYNQGDTVIISGEVRRNPIAADAIIRIIAPNGNLAQIDQVSIGQFGNFVSRFMIGEEVREAGLYKIIMTYNEITTNTTFELRSDQVQIVEIPKAEPPAEADSLAELIQAITGGNIAIIGIAVVGLMGAVVVILGVKKHSRAKQKRQTQQKYQESESYANAMGSLGRNTDRSNARYSIYDYTTPSQAPHDYREPRNFTEALNELGRIAEQSPYKRSPRPPPGVTPKYRVERPHSGRKTRPKPKPTPGSQVERILKAKDPHQIFGLPNPTTWSKVRSRYKELSKQYDPSRGTIHKSDLEIEQNNQVMKKVNNAYAKLKDEYNG